MPAGSGPGTPLDMPRTAAPLLLLPSAAAVNAKAPGERPQTALRNTAVLEGAALQSFHVAMLPPKTRLLRWEARQPSVGSTHRRLRTKLAAAPPMRRHCFGSSARLGEQLLVVQACLGCKNHLAVAKLSLMKLRATWGQGTAPWPHCPLQRSLHMLRKVAMANLRCCCCCSGQHRTCWKRPGP